MRGEELGCRGSWGQWWRRRSWCQWRRCWIGIGAGAGAGVGGLGGGTRCWRQGQRQRIGCSLRRCCGCHGGRTMVGWGGWRGWRRKMRRLWSAIACTLWRLWLGWGLGGGTGSALWGLCLGLWSLSSSHVATEKERRREKRKEKTVSRERENERLMEWVVGELKSWSVPCVEL